MPMEIASNELIALKIGVVAMQGNFREHINMLNTFPDVHAIEVRRPSDLEGVHGIIIPGGESTTISKLLKITGLLDSIEDWTKVGKPIWGTCAGLILLSKEITSSNVLETPHISTLEVCVERNYFGSQIASFISPLLATDKDFPGGEGVFIRAPSITKILDNSKVQVLAKCIHKQEELIVAIQQGNILGTTFHPELTSSTKWHEHFIGMIMRNFRLNK